MSKVVSIRLKDDQYARLQRAARRLGRTPSESAALLLNEAMRQREFPLIVFRDTTAGRQAFVEGTRLKVWQVVWISRLEEGDVAKTAEHLDLSGSGVQAALSYAVAYPDEIEDAIADSSKSIDDLRRIIPWIQERSFAEDSACGS